jgi:hypothetical protein
MGSSPTASRLEFLRYLASTSVLKYLKYALFMTIYPIGGVDFLPSPYRLRRRFVETHHYIPPEQNILEPQIAVTPGLHRAFWRNPDQ